MQTNKSAQFSGCISGACPYGEMCACGCHQTRYVCLPGDVYMRLPSNKVCMATIVPDKSSASDADTKISIKPLKIVRVANCFHYLHERILPLGHCENTKKLHQSHRTYQWVCKKCLECGYRFRSWVITAPLSTFQNKSW